jgi:hypothetical protein
MFGGVGDKPFEDGANHQLQPSKAGGIAVGGQRLGDPVGIYAV